MKQPIQSYDYRAVKPLKQWLTQSPYQSYVYGYPHKTSYRPLTPAMPLTEVWHKEKRQALFLYLHIPFCEMRCGFCNLFTTVEGAGALMTAYLQSLQRQADQVAAMLGSATFARCAIGGGTPTQLPEAHLSTVLDIAEQTMGAPLASIPVSVEVSPETATLEKLQLLRERGVDRISIGVQSFINHETEAIHRRQQLDQVIATIRLINQLNFPTLNIDLMYGIPGQTVASWLKSIQMALQFQPQELFLYPLYTRPLTRLGKTAQIWDDLRLACYRAGRELLLTNGYQQQSMRLFRADNNSNITIPTYRCQEDGMVGLGCGARSYTQNLHYATAYAVGPKQVRQIIRTYINTPDTAFLQADYGYQLDVEERQRRYILLSLLSAEGVHLPTYQRHFRSYPFTDLSELCELMSRDLAKIWQDTLYLTPTGLEWSDAIGPWLFSDKVRALMGTYQLQ